MVYSTRRFVLCLTLCYFVLVVFSPFSNAITSLGEKWANLTAILLVSGKGCGLWLWHSLDFSLTFFFQGRQFKLFLSLFWKGVYSKMKKNVPKRNRFFTFRVDPFSDGVWFLGIFTYILGCRITKTCLYNFDPLKPHFYIIKNGVYRGIHYFLFLLKNIDCGYPLEPPRRGGSNEYPQSMFWAEIWKKSEYFIWKLSFFWR